MQLVADCPRCGAAKMTFDVEAHHYIRSEYKWKLWFEVFSVCRNCNRSTSFVISQRDSGHDLLSQKDVHYGGSLNIFYEVESYLSLKDCACTPAPEHVPASIKAVFEEGATCLNVKCFNAAGTMFRLCLDMATGALLPPATDNNGPNAATRRNLGARIGWLLDNGRLPEPLRELSTCVREDGNDGAHAGTLEKDGAEDLLDFTVALLQRLYTEPERLRLAKERRDARRQAVPAAPASKVGQK